MKSRVCPHLSCSGFTLLELMVVVAIIGILVTLGLNSYGVYKADAAYAVASATIRDGLTAFEAGITDLDTPPGAVPLTTQTTKGPITDAAASALLPEMRLPGDISFQVSYNPSCTIAACESATLQVRHCIGDEYIRWVRFGDGLGVLVEHIAGAGC